MLTFFGILITDCIITSLPEHFVIPGHRNVCGICAMNLSSTNLLSVCANTLSLVLDDYIQSERARSSHHALRSCWSSGFLHPERVTLSSDVVQTGSLLFICGGPLKPITLLGGTYG